MLKMQYVLLVDFESVKCDLVSDLWDLNVLDVTLFLNRKVKLSFHNNITAVL